MAVTRDAKEIVEKSSVGMHQTYTICKIKELNVQGSRFI
jgi:hypothetical protein